MSQGPQTGVTPLAPDDAAPPAGSGGGPLHLGPSAWTLSALCAILVVGVADDLSGTDLSLILFYLAPIALGTWFVDRRAGIVLSIAAALVSFLADGHHRLVTLLGEAHLGVLLWNAFVQLGTSLGLVLTLAALRGRLEDEELLARTDALTHIPNRRAFFEAANLELERARRRRRPMTLAYVDVDDFKIVNDQLGHAQGDALLVEIARTLRAETRAVDAVARLGGDEFGLLLPETDAIDAEALLSRLRTAILKALKRGGWSVGVSVGAATFRFPPASVDEMMARADELMYAAKREEKGSIRLGTFPGEVAGPDASAALPR